MCGIFGRISVENKPLAKDKFNALGVINDSRGGDSCGIFFDGHVEYGFKDTKYYSDFLLDSKLLKQTHETKVSIGHCRKASIGDISLSTAQPVCITDQNGNIEFVLIHNGTIYNYEDLAKKYIPNIDIKWLTDSQVMARIFYYTGYNALAEYDGAAVFVIIDYRDQPQNLPRVFMYKGASKLYENSKDETTERPLYVLFNEEELWFSSIAPMLDAILYPQSCLSITPNMLIELKHSEKIELISIMTVDRSKCIQSKKYTYATSYNNYGKYNYYDNHYDYSEGNKNTGGKFGNFEKAQKPIKGVDNKTVWVVDSDTNVKDRMCIHEDGLYRINKELAHGKFNLSRFGYIYINVQNDSYYFFQGRLLPNEKILNMLLTVCEHFNLKPIDLDAEFSEVIDKYSYIPVVNIVEDRQTKERSLEIFEVDDFDNILSYTGTICPLFSSTCNQFNVVDGVLVDKETSVKINANSDAFHIFKEMWEDIDIDVETVDIMDHIRVRSLKDMRYGTDREKTKLLSE